jgi:hypothetical protein
LNNSKCKEEKLLTTIKLPRKKAIVLMAVVLSLSLVFGGFSFAQEAGNQVQSLSLDKSIELALENNSDIKQAKLDVERRKWIWRRLNIFLMRIEFLVWLGTPSKKAG